MRKQPRRIVGKERHTLRKKIDEILRVTKAAKYMMDIVGNLFSLENTPFDDYLDMVDGVKHHTFTPLL